MPYCIYLRKSRADTEAEARGEGETLARHERILLELARQQKLDITEIYREIVSGESIASRQVMQRLLSEVGQGVWDGVLVMEVERLARGDTIDQGIVAQSFKYSDTRIITPNKTYDPNNEIDEEYFEFGLFMSRREYKTINRRLQRGRAAAVKEGKYVGNKTPYGYRRVKLEHDTGFTLEPVPDEAAVIRLIFDLYTSGEMLPDGTSRRLGVALIARRLNAMRAPTKTGGQWVPVSVRDILINPVYAGKVRWNWRPTTKKVINGAVVVERHRTPPDKCIVTQGLHPAIISEDKFNAAHEIMLRNPPRPVPVEKRIENPLAGLIICAECGRRMTRRPKGSRQPEDVIMCHTYQCGNVASYLKYVEARVLSGLSTWLEEYKIEWGGEDNSTPIPQIEQKRAAVTRITSDLAKLEKQLGSLHDLLEQGVYSTAMFLERSRHLTSRIAETKEELTAAKADVAREEAREEGRLAIIPKIEHLLEVYYDLPSAKAKNEMLREVIEKAIYRKTHSARWHGSPDDFELTIYPHLPDSFDEKVRMIRT